MSKSENVNISSPARATDHGRYSPSHSYVHIHDSEKALLLTETIRMKEMTTMDFFSTPKLQFHVYNILLIAEITSNI